MFKDERPGLVGMAGEAYRVLGGSRPQLPGQKPTVRIMAIAACNQSFIYPVMVRLRKVWFHFEVAGVAQHRLAGFHQMSLHFGGVHRVTVHASNVVLEVLRAKKVRVLFSELMALQTLLARFLPGEFFEADDLAYISGLGVLFSGTVAGFAALPLHAMMLVEQRLPMGSAIVGLANVLMAGLAGIGANVLRRICRVIAAAI